MSDFNFLNVPRYYRALPHQDNALLFLWERTPENIKEKFISLWRNNNWDDITTKLIESVPADRKNNARTCIPLLLKWCKEYNVIDYNHIAYILATVSHESAFLPRREIRANPKIQPQLYWLQERYWNTGYYGRGYIQLTWKSNYEGVSKRIGVDLVNNPDLMLEPDISANVTVVGMREGLFTGKKLSDYDLPNGEYDFVNARRIVNALDKADLIATYARYYRRVLS